MKPEAQRIAIAEACGTIKWSYALPQKCVAASVPNYLNDLNAMHEAEKVLNQKQKEHYFFIIFNFYGNWPEAIQATAAQRARAFLRVIEKWKWEGE